jgi:hypothetical protein
MAMTRIIVLFNLKAGVEPGTYEEWAKRVDLPIFNRLGSIQSFEVFKSTALLGSTAPPPYHYVEIIDVKDMEAFGQDVATSAMKRVAAEFATFADATFIMTEPVPANATPGASGA